MEKKENKNETQVRLFEQIQKELPEHSYLAKIISEMLEIGIDASYRRIRGEKLLNFEETEKLCKHFGISLDTLFYGIDKKQYRFIPENLKDMKSYFSSVLRMSAITEKAHKIPDCEIILSAADIPAYHFVAYKELTLFNLFSWHKNVYDIPENYEDFINQLDVDLITKACESIYCNYKQIPSFEIWTDHTIDSTLKLLQLHFELDHFGTHKNLLIICNQLLELVHTLQEWIKKGKKGGTNVPFNFYVNEIDIGNTLILIKNKLRSRCVVRLFTINGIDIGDEQFCKEAEEWLESLIKNSTLISGISSKERFVFLTTQKQKISEFIEKINALSIS